MEIKNKFTAHIIIVTGLVLLIAAILIYAKYGQPKPAGNTVSILFLGNSFTSVNDLPKTLSDIAESLGDTVVYDMYAPGGYTLMQHSQDKQALAKIKSRPWNFVVLQDQSEMPALSDSRVNNEVMPYAIQLAELVHPMGGQSQTVFFETWGYKNGDAQYCAGNPTLCSYSQMQNQLEKSYNLMAERTGSWLSPVGEAWRLAQQNHPEIELYQSDGHHPSVAGTYLSACVFYVKLFNKSVVGASQLTLDPSEAKFLQQIAEQTVIDN